MNEKTQLLFWKKVNKNGPAPAHRPELGPCWLWTASLRNKGYGAFSYTIDGATVHDRAHRLSFVLHGGELAKGECVLHRCDVPQCVNPAHLFAGTKATNNADMLAKGRHVPGGTHCGIGNYERGITHHNARLTEDDVIAIRNDRKGGMTFSQISKKYGLAIGHVFRIIKRTAWKNVD